MVDAASNIKESEKFLELTQKGRNIETATSGAKHIETPKFLETTNKGKKIDKTNTKLNETKKSDKSVIDAKTPQKERIKEKENMTNNNIPNQESSVGNKLDINEATYYSNGNAISKDMQMKNYNNNSSFSKNENYYNQWVENTEKSKIHYNQTNVTPKQYPFKPFGI